MSYLRKICLPFLLILIALPYTGFAFTTPGTGVNWTGSDLVSNSGGVVSYDSFGHVYTSTEAIVIAATDTLSIEDDFIVDAVADDDWTVQGMFYVGVQDTTETDTIEFSGGGTDGPTGIRVEEGGNLSVYRVLMVGGGAGGDDTAIQVTDGTAFIYGSRFTDWMGNVINTFSAQLLYMENCIIHDNHEWGAAINNSSTGTIVGCYFENNNLSSPGSPKNVINVGMQGANVALIEDCHIVGADGNHAGGIVVTNMLGTAQSATIVNTTIENCSYGISVQYGGAYAEIYDCTFINNTSYNNYAYGMGISVLGPAAVQATGCTISGNLYGITCSGNSAGEPTLLCLGVDGSEEPYEQGHNRIYDNFNTFFDHGYDLWNNTSLAISAQNNYWGTTDLDEIAANIHDHADDASMGVVTYQPIWDGVEENQAPVITSTTPDSGDVYIIVGDNVIFDATATDPDGDELSTSVFLNGEEIDVGLPAMIQFNIARTDTVMVVFTDPDMATASATWYVRVDENTAPTIDTYTPTELAFTVDVNDEVVFDATGSDADEDTLSWQVYYNGELLRTTIPATITFSEVGTDTVKVMLLDTHGGSDEVQWIITVVDPSGVGDEGALPTEFAVNTYPNPFNAQLRIRYSLPSYKDVTYSIYSIDGRLVERQVLGGQVPGHHEVSWNAEGAASGVYLVRFTAGSESITRKITLVR